MIEVKKTVMMYNYETGESARVSLINYNNELELGDFSSESLGSSFATFEDAYDFALENGYQKDCDL